QQDRPAETVLVGRQPGHRVDGGLDARPVVAAAAGGYRRLDGRARQRHATALVAAAGEVGNAVTPVVGGIDQLAVLAGVDKFAVDGRGGLPARLAGVGRECERHAGRVLAGQADEHLFGVAFAVDLQAEPERAGFHAGAEVEALDVLVDLDVEMQFVFL